MGHFAYIVKLTDGGSGNFNGELLKRVDYVIRRIAQLRDSWDNEELHILL